MNIFYVSRDPYEAAKSLCDIHVCKLIIESAQMLSTAHFIHGSWTSEMYKPTHKNHPSAVWSRSSVLQYNWLYNHFRALLSEYTFRYGKTHKSDRLVSVLQNTPVSFIEYTDPPQCMPDEYKCEDTVTAYRNYYISKQLTMKRPMKWTKREAPEWFQKLESNG